MGVDLCETVWDNPAQGVEGYEPWWLQYKNWELAGLIVSPPGPNNPQLIKPDFYQMLYHCLSYLILSIYCINSALLQSLSPTAYLCYSSPLHVPELLV